MYITESYVTEAEKLVIEDWLIEGGHGNLHDGKTSRQIGTDVFKRYGTGCEYFVETGTYIGGGIYKAIAAGLFTRYFSCELDEQRQKANLDKFNYRSDVELYQGYSTEALKEILPKIDRKSLFYLDAHAEGGGVPTFEELDLIKEMCDTNDHTILVDDIPIYFGDGSALHEKLLWVNPEYIIERVDTIAPGYQMVAYVD